MSMTGTVLRESSHLPLRPSGHFYRLTPTLFTRYSYSHTINDVTACVNVSRRCVLKITFLHMCRLM